MENNQGFKEKPKFYVKGYQGTTRPTAKNFNDSSNSSINFIFYLVAVYGVWVQKSWGNVWRWVSISVRFGLFQGQVYEHLVFSCAIFMPVISPIIYIVFIKPYREFFVRYVIWLWFLNAKLYSRSFCKKCFKNVVQDRTQTQMYSNPDQSTSGNRQLNR